ncbi:MAG: lipase family alpha/beta hydrolase [Haliea sp.]
MAVSMLACSLTPSRPDLQRLYYSARGNPAQPPLIIVPGVLGTRLENGEGRELWPGSVWSLLTSDYDELALAIDPSQLSVEDDGVVPAGIFASAAGRRYYQQIITVLEDAGGYVLGVPGEAVTDSRPRFYILSYDWRKDAMETVHALDTMIEQVRLDHGSPDLKVDVLAHSMGGLVARYYARYGTVDLLNGNDFPVTHEGAVKLHRMILVGTPNLGSVESMHSLIEGRAFGLRRVQPEVIMTMPAIYQLFPHALNRWLFTTNGQHLERDQFDARIWQRFELGPWSPSLQRRLRATMTPVEVDIYLQTLQAFFAIQLERARRFSWSLTVPEPAGGITPVIFGGDCALTPARVVVEEVHQESVLRLYPSQISNPVPGVDYESLMLEPGDGTVTKASLLSRDVLHPGAPRHRYINFGVSSVFFICERHDVLTGNITFQDNLLHVLLSLE